MLMVLKPMSYEIYTAVVAWVLYFPEGLKWFCIPFRSKCCPVPLITAITFLICMCSIKEWYSMVIP